MADNLNTSAYNFDDNNLISTTAKDETTANWGVNAKRSIYNVFANQSDKLRMSRRNLLDSRLWHGVPQLSDDQMKMFEAAYTGHTFIFVVDVPHFMYRGLYAGDTNMHQQIKNLKAVIERASTGFSGPTNIMAESNDQNDGDGRKISHIVSVTKEQNNISLKLHEFAGLPVKNAIESWLTGIYDVRSQHGNYHGNLGIQGGWCLANHSMSMLVVQVTPDWTTIQDAAYYYNMVPTEVPFDSFNWTKGDQAIIDDYDIEFYANEERSPAIMYAAEKYMNNRVLSMVATSVYNSRQFVVHDFNENLGTSDSLTAANERLDKMQYNLYINNKTTTDDGKQIINKNYTEGSTLVKQPNLSASKTLDLDIKSVNESNPDVKEENTNS